MPTIRFWFNALLSLSLLLSFIPSAAAPAYATTPATAAPCVNHRPQ